MGLRKKTFLYSIALAAIMIAFVIGYFVLMLPSLYVDYMINSNLKETAKIQKGYMETRTYDDLAVKNPTVAYTLEVPDMGNEVYVAGKSFKAAVRIKDEELQALLDYFRRKLQGAGDAGEDPSDSASPESVLAESLDGIDSWDGADISAVTELWTEKFKEKFGRQDLLPEDYPIEVVLVHKGRKQIYQGEYSKVHSLSDGIIVYEAGVSDGNYSYTTYVAMGRTQDAFIVTVLPTMTPQMEEIIPIVMGSLPMIVTVIILVVLISSRFFSGKIVNPIIRLAAYAQTFDISRSGADDILGRGSNDRGSFGNRHGADSTDEIGVLAENLRELHGKLRDNYEELERRNRMLEEENERQEVFLQASSHQLKTPIAAALLLVEGMINEVGKYKDTQAYLPEVKKQLLSMRRIVEDILQLNYHVEHMQEEQTDLRALAKELVRAYAVQAEDKGLQVTVEGNGTAVADREMLRKIVDNLLSNAVQYTPPQNKIELRVRDDELCVINYGVTIDGKLLPNIMEPFVSSDGSGKGRGLGLYVAAYYGRLMGCKLEIENAGNGVQARLLFIKKG